MRSFRSSETCARQVLHNPAKVFKKVLDELPPTCEYIPCAAALAQLDRAFDYESKGRRFESYMPHHNAFEGGPIRPSFRIHAPICTVAT